MMMRKKWIWMVQMMSLAWEQVVDALSEIVCHYISPYGVK
jgi:hypothetical protein